MRRFPIFLALLGCLYSGGCAFLPEFKEPPLTTAGVIRHLKCEVYEAAYRYPENEWVRSWTVGLILELQVNHLGGLDAESSTWTFPLNKGATFSVALAGGFSGQGTRTERFNFKFKPSEFEKNPSQCDAEEPSRYALLGGGLGIADLFRRVTLTTKVANVQRWQSLDYNLEFIVKANAGVTPKFNLIPIGKEKTFTGSAKWTGSRSDTQSAKMTLTPPSEAVCPVTVGGNEEWPDPTDCPKPVYIVKARGVCKNISKKDVCEAALGCEWDASARKCQEITSSAMWMENLKTKRYTAPKRAPVPTQSEAETNTNAQILNTLNNLKVSN